MNDTANPTHERAASQYLYFRDATTPGCVVAVDPTMIRPDGLREGFAGTFPRSNSGVSWGALSDASLGEPLSEAQARAIHPRLFERIEDHSQTPDAHTDLYPIDKGSRWTDTDGPGFVVQTIWVDEDGVTEIRIRTDDGETVGLTVSDLRRRMASGEIAPA